MAKTLPPPLNSAASKGPPAKSAPLIPTSSAPPPSSSAPIVPTTQGSEGTTSSVLGKATTPTGGGGSLEDRLASVERKLDLLLKHFNISA